MICAWPRKASAWTRSPAFSIEARESLPRRLSRAGRGGFVLVSAVAAESLYQKNGARITADRYEGLCLKLLDLKKIPETEKWCMRLARQHGNALAAYTCRLKLYFTMGEKEKFFEVLQELKESDIIIDNETLELILIFS